MIWCKGPYRPLQTPKNQIFGFGTIISVSDDIRSIMVIVIELNKILDFWTIWAFLAPPLFLGATKRNFCLRHQHLLKGGHSEAYG